jgi:hypothetical protein
MSRQSSEFFYLSLMVSYLQVLSERYGMASKPQRMQVMQELAKLQTLEENANLAAALKLTLQDCDSLQHTEIESMPSYGSEQSALMDDFMLALKLQEQEGAVCQQCLQVRSSTTGTTSNIPARKCVSVALICT